MSVPLDLPTIRRRFATHRPNVATEREAERQAAVAAILRPTQDDTEVLLIRRAEREGDPWSGHMAFPGGHCEPQDPNLLATALRETREEIGLPLQRDGELLGRLDDLPAIARGRFLGMVITPFVFALQREPELTLGPEVADVCWLPLGRMLRGDYDATKTYHYEGEVLELPGYRIADGIVWGMTYRMLQGLIGVLSRS